MINSFTITYVVDNGVHDFTTPYIPVDALVPLINVLKWQLTKQIAIDTAPSFADERVKQHERHLEHCQKTNKKPQQQFIDFPLERKY
jgi:hypothetical protein